MTAAGFPNLATPEMELLYACVAPQPTLGSVVRSIDWTRFLQLATNHHVVPLVHRNLRNAERNGWPIPGEYLAYLQRLCQGIAASNLRATGILHRLQAGLAAEGIQAVPIKGPALAVLAYGDTALRQFEDLDLLVPQEDMPRAVAWLERDGYVAGELPAADNRGCYFSSLQDWWLQKIGDPLHMGLKPVLISHLLCVSDSVRYMMAACLSLVTRAGPILQAPGPEAMFLAVCADGTNEMWTKLASVADVAALLAAYPKADWAGLLRDAGAFGLRRSLLIGASLAEVLLACPVPEAFHSVDEGSAVRRLVLAAAQQLCAGKSLQTGVVRQTLFTMRSRDRVHDRWRYLTRLLFVPGAVELGQIALPDRLYPLYSCMRPFRLAWDAWRGGSRRIVAAAPKPEP